MKKVALVSVILLTLNLLVPPVQAQEESPWQVAVVPYMWLTGIQGEMTLRSTEVDFSKSVGELLSALKFGGSLGAQVGYSRYLLWGQIDYFLLGDDDFDIESAEFESEVLLGQLAIGYAFDGFYENQRFDLLLGMQTLSMTNELDLAGSSVRSQDFDAIDPIALGRASFPIAPSRIDGWAFDLIAGIGGGGDSDLVYLIAPQLRWHFAAQLALRLGWRTIGYDLESNSENTLDIRMSGLGVGLEIKF